MEEDKSDQLAFHLDSILSLSENILAAASSIPRDASGAISRAANEAIAQEKAAYLATINAEKGPLLSSIKALYELTQSNEVSYTKLYVITL